eukprot:scaffold2522_cov121-Isochrysis_galbana.AAC.7
MRHGRRMGVRPALGGVRRWPRRLRAAAAGRPPPGRPPPAWSCELELRVPVAADARHHSAAQGRHGSPACSRQRNGDRRWPLTLRHAAAGCGVRVQTRDTLAAKAPLASGDMAEHLCPSIYNVYSPYTLAATLRITVWHASGRAVRALERDTRPCHRGPEIFTSPGKPNNFRVVPLCYVGATSHERVYRPKRKRVDGGGPSSIPP